MSKTKNVFERQSEFTPEIPRNVVNLSNRNNLTMNFGDIIPHCVREVLPGDTFKIDSATLLKAMPINFPVQTAMKAYVHYYYVRNRILYKDWEDFITGVTGDDKTAPYLKMTANNYAEMFSTGTLGDYLGMPTILTGIKSMDMEPIAFPALKDTYEFNLYPYEVLSTTATNNNIVQQRSVYKWYLSNYPATSTSLLRKAYVLNLSKYDQLFSFGSSFDDVSLYTNIEYVPNHQFFDTSVQDGYRFTFDNLSIGDPERVGIWLALWHKKDGFITPYWTSIGAPNASGVVDGDKKIILKINDLYKLITDCQSLTDIEPVLLLSNVNQYTSYTLDEVLTFDTNQSTGVTFGKYIDKQSLDFYSNPLQREAINALPFRAYEAICNYYYRNERVDPYYINGEPVYNQWIPTKEGGLDNNIYKIQKRNWVSDFLTSAVPSPQQGVAPLVGVTSHLNNVTFSFELEEDFAGQPAGTVVNVTAGVDTSGNLTGISQYDEAVPIGSLQRLRDVISQGISINDLRNVNAFQRFLENGIRKGYKYIDQMLSHFGVAPDKVAIQAPEFIGGYTFDVNVKQITNQAETAEGSLGDIKGQISVQGQMGRQITHYCPEHGFIIGVISIAPMPAYQQLMPKFFYKLNKLDYYFPEFGKIGFQPIKYKEVCPLQIDPDNLNDTFGYQRPWYDYLDAVDEYHGAFRDTLQDFLLTRTFTQVPELGHNFVRISDEQLNDIWAVSANADFNNHKFFGQIYNEIIAKRPIPIGSVNGELL